MKVIHQNPIKAGFRPSLMVQAAARGRQHDPYQVIGAEVTVLADSPADFQDIRKVQEVVLRALIRQPYFHHLHGGQLRQASAAVQYTHPAHGSGWVVRYTLD